MWWCVEGRTCTLLRSYDMYPLVISTLQIGIRFSREGKLYEALTKIDLQEKFSNNYSQGNGK